MTDAAPPSHRIFRRVFHYVNHALPVQDGYTLRTSSIARAQSDRGMSATVVDALEHDVETLRGDGVVTEVRSRCAGGVLHVRPPRDLRQEPDTDGALEWLQRRFQRRPWWKEGALRGYARWLRGEVGPAHVVHAHTPAPVAMDGSVLADELGAAFLYEVRGFWGLSQAAHTRGGVDLAEAVAGDLQVCALAGHVTTAGRGIADLLVAHGVPSSHISVVPNGVDTERFVPRDPGDDADPSWKPPGKLVFGCATNVRRLEGLQVLVDAWPAVLRELPDAVFVVLGVGEYLDELRERVAATGLGDTFLFAGRIPHAEMPHALSALDVCVLPRLPEIVCDVVTPLKPLEAMACGVPVIAANVGGLREVVTDGDTGILFEAGNADAAASACIAVGRDPDLRTSLAARAREWVLSARDWRVVAARYDEVYADL